MCFPSIVSFFTCCIWLSGSVIIFSRSYFCFWVASRYSSVLLVSLLCIRSCLVSSSYCHISPRAVRKLFRRQHIYCFIFLQRMLVYVAFSCCFVLCFVVNLGLHGTSALRVHFLVESPVQFALLCPRCFGFVHGWMGCFLLYYCFSLPLCLCLVSVCQVSFLV